MLAMAMAMARLSRSSYRSPYYAILFTAYLQLLFAVIGTRVRTSKMKGE